MCSQQSALSKSHLGRSACRDEFAASIAGLNRSQAHADVGGITQPKPAMTDR
jgi:hypothetical protein